MGLYKSWMNIKKKKELRVLADNESAAKDLVNLTKTLICNHTGLMTRVQQKVEGSDFSLNFCVSQYKASWS